MKAKKKIATTPPEEQELERRLVPIQHAASAFIEWQRYDKLTGESDYIRANEALRQVKELYEKAEAERTEFTGPMNKLIKKWNARAAVVTKPLEALEEHLKRRLIGPYLEAQRQAALKSVEKQAARAEAKGQTQYAEDLRASAALTPVAPVIEGQRLSTIWKARITDLNAFLAAVQAGHPVAGLARAGIEEAVVKAMSAAARGAKDAAAAPPGIEFVPTTNIGMSI